MLANLSCDPRFSHVCARAHVDGHWLTADFYKGDRAMRESGFDPRSVGDLSTDRPIITPPFA